MFANPFGALTLCFWIVRETPTLVTLPRKFLSPLIMFNRSWHAATCSSICYRVSACGTNLEHTFNFSKSSLKIRRTTVFGMPSVSAINRDVTFRSSSTILSTTAAMLSSVRLVVGRPLRSSSFTDSLPSLNRLCHSKIVVRLNAASQ